MLPVDRMILWPVGAYVAGNLTDKDVMYCSLPMYHAAAGAYAAGLALIYGVPVIYTRKFSASRFWSDCAQHGATVS